MKMIELYNRLTRVPTVLDDLVKGVNSLSELIRYRSEPKPEPPPFVLIFIQGFRVKTEYGEYNNLNAASEKDEITGKPVTIAVSHDAPHMFSFQPDIKIANLQVAVICDVRRVKIEMIRVANQDLNPYPEGAPMSYFDGICGPWNKITVHCSLR